jgi:hypothetical protein
MFMFMMCKVVLDEAYLMCLFKRSLKHTVSVEGICFVQALGIMNAFCL